jgi:hypothetical protein
MAVTAKTNSQRIRVLAIAVIFFTLAGIATFVISTVNLIRLRNQTAELKRLADSAAIQAVESRRLGGTAVAQQETLKQIALEARNAAEAIKDCTIPEGECFKQQQARDKAIVEDVIRGVSGANRRLLTREIRNVETATQTQGEATRITVEEKTEQVKETVIHTPAGPVEPPVCALELGTIGLVCDVAPETP